MTIQGPKVHNSIVGRLPPHVTFVKKTFIRLTLDSKFSNMVVSFMHSYVMLMQAYFVTNMEPIKFWEFMSLILEGLGYERYSSNCSFAFFFFRRHTVIEVVYNVHRPRVHFVGIFGEAKPGNHSNWSIPLILFVSVEQM